ncbi:protein C12orf4 homolog isoform X1 [Mytilus trossulus]|uniref:protein C12orf4 homolog isoform X1 n=1 Tax=Mytilus trossulus TaxID=6551 RepID=UPI00300759BB
MSKEDFKFTFLSKDLVSTLEVPVPIPLKQPLDDFIGQLVTAHNLPCFIENELKEKLDAFVWKHTQQTYEKNVQKKIDEIKKADQASVDSLVDKWSKAFTQEVKTYAKVEAETQEEKFSKVYHALIHSPALDTLLNLEHTYSLTVEDLLRQRDADLGHLQQRQREEMDEAVKTYSNDEVNELAQNHFEQMQMIESKWTKELTNLKDTQKQEFREWVIKVHEDTQSQSKPYIGRMRNISTTLPEADDGERSEATVTMEESFTIHLGAQMKTTHNLRLLCTDILDLCRHKTHTVGGMVIPQPQRLQTAMSLYSNNLCGLILLTDNNLSMYTGLKKQDNNSQILISKQDFSRVCEQSTDFHFPDLQQQLTSIEQQLPLRDTSKGNKSSKESKDIGLQTGDFYITKHSNLSEVHVVFHLVTDNSIRSSDITSRHPVILSIRNIIKQCFRHDLHTITIPLLLAHHMSEEMTIPWCQRRAELVFKCVKGFMMEMATYESSSSRTIQFLVPLGISYEMFSGISNMLTTIFRVSNAIKV